MESISEINNNTVSSCTNNNSSYNSNNNNDNSICSNSLDEFEVWNEVDVQQLLDVNSPDNCQLHLSLLFDTPSFRHSLARTLLYEDVHRMWEMWLGQQEESHKRKGKRTNQDLVHLCEKVMREEENNKDTQPILPMTGTTHYARVIRMFGCGRLIAICGDGVKRLCIIRGAMYKINWIDVNDVILVSVRDFNLEKADVILKYSQHHVTQLEQQKLLPPALFTAPPDAALSKYRSCVKLEEDSDSEASDIVTGAPLQKIPPLAHLCFHKVVSYFLLLHKDMWKIHRNLQDEVLEAVKEVDAQLLDDDKIKSFLDSSRTRLVLSHCYQITNNTLHNIAAYSKHITILYDLSRVSVTSCRGLVVACQCRMNYSCHTSPPDLTRCWKITDIGTKNLFRLCRELRVLSIAGCVRLTDKTLSKLGQYGESLVSLNISNCFKFTTVGMKQLLSKCKTLQHLDVSDCENVDMTTLVRYLPEVEMLAIRNMHMSDFLMCNIGNDCHKLKELDIRNSAFDVASLAKLIKKGKSIFLALYVDEDDASAVALIVPEYVHLLRAHTNNNDSNNNSSEKPNRFTPYFFPNDRRYQQHQRQQQPTPQQLQPWEPRNVSKFFPKGRKTAKPKEESRTRYAWDRY